ncbi:MAG: hypothetical protein ACFFD4_01225 [Candidatus Odinarchaeota archaeon]
MVLLLRLSIPNRFMIFTGTARVKRYHPQSWRLAGRGTSGSFSSTSRTGRSSPARASLITCPSSGANGRMNDRKRGLTRAM